MNPPAVGILGVGRRDATGRLTLCLSFDHAAVDGAEAAVFLADVANALERGQGS